MSIRFFIEKNLLIAILVLFLVLIPVISFAQTGNINPIAKIENPLANTSTINDFIRVLLEGVLKIGIPIVALAVIYSGFLFVKAQGNPEAITKAKDAILWTLVGAAVLLGAWAIAKLVADTVLAL